MQKEIFRFPTEGKPVSCLELKAGHINRSYLIETDAGLRYVLQRVNGYVFPDIEAIMENVRALRRHIEAVGRPLPMISYIDALDGKSLYRDSEGGAWRLYRFVEDSICPDAAESGEDMLQSGIAFGAFLDAFADFPAERLKDTIPDFHNTPDRYRKLRQAISSDPMGMAEEIKAELEFIFAREEEGCLLHRMRESGALPLRVTHNDTKISNVLLHEKTRKALCVIDLDTVMPGLSAYDFGDAIRYGACTAPEDSHEQSAVDLDTGLFRAFTRGYIRACRCLNEAEIRMLPRGAYVLTLENGIRFLTDYLLGDKYYATSRPRQNLDRGRTQLALVRAMERRRDELCRIVEEEAKAANRFT